MLWRLQVPEVCPGGRFYASGQPSRRQELSQKRYSSCTALRKAWCMRSRTAGVAAAARRSVSARPWAQAAPKPAA
jgi:hypothetical protein